MMGADLETGCPAWASGGNWLVTSAAAKVDLVRRFRRALNDAGLKLIATDASPHAPALYEADHAFLVPPDQAPDFIETLIRQCRHHGVRVILPTRDTELPLLLKWRQCLEKARIWVLASPLTTVACCQDKVAFHQWCLENGLPVLPALTNPVETDFPVFVRPRQSAGGQGSYMVSRRADLILMVDGFKANECLIQSYCPLPEYTIDALFDFRGNLTQWVVRRRIKVEAGESKVSQTVRVEPLDGLMVSIGERMEFRGPTTVQAFFSADEGPWLIEINPRFGGACALGIEAGLASPERLVALVQGEMAEFKRPRPIQVGLTMLRHSDNKFLEAAQLVQPPKTGDTGCD